MLMHEYLFFTIRHKCTSTQHTIGVGEQSLLFHQFFKADLENLQAQIQIHGEVKCLL